MSGRSSQATHTRRFARVPRGNRRSPRPGATSRGASDTPPAAGDVAPGPDDLCCFTSQTYTFPELLGVDTPLDDVRDAVERALEDHEGWRLPAQQDVPGGYVGVDAEGPGGARLELRTKTDAELRVVAELDGPCEREQLPLP